MLDIVDHAAIVKRAMAKRDLEEAGLAEDEVTFATAENGMDTEKEELLSVPAAKKRRRPKPRAAALVGLESTTGTRSGKAFY